MPQLIPKDSKDLPAFRAFLTSQRTQACSTASVFSGPLKVAMEKMVADIDAVLAKLPTDEARENWCLDNQLDSLFNLLTQAAAAAALSALELAKATNGASEQMATAVTAEIGKRVAAGELFTKENFQTATTVAAAAQIKSQLDAGELVAKDRLQQLCSESKLTGIAEGEQKVRAEITATEATNKLIGERKALLQAAGLPLPDAEIEKIVLGGTDVDFKARKDLFEARHANLKKESIQLNASDVLANLWLDESAYKGFERTVKALPQLKFSANPLAGGGAGGGEKPAAAPVLAAL